MCTKYFDVNKRQILLAGQLTGNGIRTAFLDYITVSIGNLQGYKVCFLILNCFLREGNPFTCQLYVRVVTFFWRVTVGIFCTKTTKRSWWREHRKTPQFTMWIEYVATSDQTAHTVKSSEGLWLACCRGRGGQYKCFTAIFLALDTGISESRGSREMAWLHPSTD